MHSTKVTCLLILLALLPGGVSSQDKHPSQLLFENADFSVYSVRDSEGLASVSQETNFGVLVLVDQSGTIGHESFGFRFSGPTGRHYVLGYGTPAGLVSAVDRGRVRIENANAVWLVPKSDTEITNVIFARDLPESFNDSVREDLLSLGFLADKTGSGLIPSEKEQTRARAGFADLAFKSKWFSLFPSSPEKPIPLIDVKVRTLRAGKEISNWTVSYVLAGWEGDEYHTRTFNRESSPTSQPIPPGMYKIWASRKKKVGSPKTLPVGDDTSLKKEVDLEIP